MKKIKESDFVKVDTRNRITIPKKLSSDLVHLYRIYEKDGKIILEPVKEIPKEEMWLFEPKNRHILEAVKEGLSQKGTIHRSFKSNKK